MSQSKKIHLESFTWFKARAALPLFFGRLVTAARGLRYTRYLDCLGAQVVVDAAAAVKKLYCLLRLYSASKLPHSCLAENRGSEGRGLETFFEIRHVCILRLRPFDTILHEKEFLILPSFGLDF